MSIWSFILIIYFIRILTQQFFNSPFFNPNTELDSLFQDAFLKKEQQILANNIKESEEVKKGFYIHLADALETQKIEAEKVLKTQLESQVILLFFSFFFFFFIILYYIIFSFSFHFFSFFYGACLWYYL